jgi:MFS family permease
MRLLVAAGTSFYGDWLTTVALVVLLYRVTGSPVGPGLYMVARVGPKVIGPFPGGALADRFGPARVAALCAIGQGALTAAIVVLADAGLIWPIYVAVALAQFLGSAAQPCYGALIPRVTTPERLGRIQGTYSALSSSSVLVSPALGALLLRFVSPEALIIVDAATFIVAAALITTLAGIGGDAGVALSIRSIPAGLPVIMRDPMLRFLTAAYISNGAAVTALQAVLVVVASQRFGHDELVGLLYASVGAGAVLGTLPVIRRTPARVGTAPIIAGSVLELAPLAALVFIPILPVDMLMLFLSAMGATLYQTRGSVGLQQRVPRQLLGRATAVVRFALNTGMLLGAIAAVSLVRPLGWQSTVLIVCAVGAALLFITAVSESSA